MSLGLSSAHEISPWSMADVGYHSPMPVHHMGPAASDATSKASMLATM